MSARLLIVRTADAESEAAAEFRYLEEHRSLQIGRCFSSHASCLVQQLPHALDEGGADAILVLTSGRVMVSEATLCALWGAVSEGHEVAVPARLQDSGLLPPGGIDTLRQFEEVERESLRRPWPEVVDRVPVTPLSLWRPAAFRAMLATTGAASGTLPTEVAAAGLRVAVRGLYHEFIDYYGHCRSDVLPLIPATAREVLEIGCGRGLTGAEIQSRLGCRVTGVELNPVAAAEARSRLHEVLTGDVESLELNSRFDAIIALELIEHLVDPLQFLRRMRSLLRPGGRLVLSTPNIAHHAIVADLLAGRWDYLPTGTMCYTHLRFFTRRSLQDWLAMAGCRSFEILPRDSHTPPELAGWARDNPDIGTRNFFVLIDV